MTTLALFALRGSEIRGLIWADVDLKGGVIQVRRRADCYNPLGRRSRRRARVTFRPARARRARRAQSGFDVLIENQIKLARSRLSKSLRTSKLSGRFASPPTAGVTEGTRLLETKKPSDPRDRHAFFLQIADGQVRFELLEYLVKCHALCGEPTCQRSFAHPKLLCDNVHFSPVRAEAG